MKNTIRAMIECSVICFAVLLILHRRVISSFLTGDALPEVPEWHKNCCKCCK
ncbi:MAG: hypothetical protein IJ055_07275 [Oscillospiraceae bacterium]|nr:hypothetical protein [Oscillospiraceae bacterium]